MSRLNAAHPFALHEHFDRTERLHTQRWGLRIDTSASQPANRLRSCEPDREQDRGLPWRLRCGFSQPVVMIPAHDYRHRVLADPTRSGADNARGFYSR
jgi:hypothetical protein